MIVLAFTPSANVSDWQLNYEDGRWFYTPRVRFYDTKCKELKSYCPRHTRDVGNEQYFNLKTGRTVKEPRIYINHYPQRCEWEKLRTIVELRRSPLVA